MGECGEIGHVNLESHFTDLFMQSRANTRVVAQAYSFIIDEAGVDVPEVQGHLQLDGKVKACLDYTRSCHRK